MQEGITFTGVKAAKCLIIIYSYHHNNTAKIALEFSEVLHAKIETSRTRMNLHQN